MQDPTAAGLARHTDVAAEDEALLARLPLFAGIEPATLRVLFAGASQACIPALRALQYAPI